MALTPISSLLSEPCVFWSRRPLREGSAAGLQVFLDIHISKSWFWSLLKGVRLLCIWVQMLLLEFQRQPHLSGAPAGVCCHHLPLGLLPYPLPGSLSHPHWSPRSQPLLDNWLLLLYLPLFTFGQLYVRLRKDLLLFGWHCELQTRSSQVSCDVVSCPMPEPSCTAALGHPAFLLILCLCLNFHHGLSFSLPLSWNLKHHPILRYAMGEWGFEASPSLLQEIILVWWLELVCTLP